MRIFAQKHLIITTIFALTACTADKTPNMDTAIPIQLVATHAFDTDTHIKSIAFVPNNVAPWLGRLILLDDTGHLHSTDIEGRRMISLAPKKYIDILGLSLDNAAGVVLAINENNEIEAFIESSDDGEFSPMAYSGKPLKVTGFCKSVIPTAKNIQVLTVERKMQDLSIHVNGKIVEQIIVQNNMNTKKGVNCQTDTANTISFQPLKRDVKQSFNPLATADTKLDTALQPHLSAHIIQAKEGRLFSLNADDKDIIYSLSIENGLSIQGIEKIDYVTGTTANYGGAAFADGFIAMINNDEQRIVFLSREYVGRKITETALNPK